jgi:hypothetical protein
MRVGSVQKRSTSPVRVTQRGYRLAKGPVRAACSSHYI